MAQLPACRVRLQEIHCPIVSEDVPIHSSIVAYYRHVHGQMKKNESLDICFVEASFYIIAESFFNVVNFTGK